MTPDDELYVDCCPDCDHRNPTVPDALTPTRTGVRGTYRCSEGHDWTCSWAEPARAISVTP
jgi:hypothetical protein